MVPRGRRRVIILGGLRQPTGDEPFPTREPFSGRSVKSTTGATVGRVEGSEGGSTHSPTYQKQGTRVTTKNKKGRSPVKVSTTFHMGSEREGERSRGSVASV